LAIQFSGEFTTPRSPDEVFDFLSDPNQFGPLLPDFQSMSMQDATHFTVKVKVGVGNIRGSAELKMELIEAVKPLRAQYKGQGSAVGSQVTVSAGFDLTPVSEGTKVIWKGETSIFGKLASMAGGMLEPLGRKNIQKLIDGLQNALATPVVSSAWQVPIPEPAMPLPQSGTADAPPIPQSQASDVARDNATTKNTAAGPGSADDAVLAPAKPVEGEHGDRNP
jgi:carbon monoxide dehydrogenase subunit G